MIGFHLDFNTAAFRDDYLREFLPALRAMGYDTLIWELEGYVRWTSCPESAAPDAVTPEQFSRLLNFSRELGFRNIPLLQTLGHCEYVLANESYAHLREIPDASAPYCPNAPGFAEFLDRWIREMLQVFHDAEFFHLGCDEAWRLGESCPRCGGMDKTDLLAGHINRVAALAQKHGVTPVIWADMALIHPAVIERISRDIVLFDWRYELYRGCGKVWCWDGRGGTARTEEEIPPEIRRRFFDALYPDGDEPGREPELFYTAHYLRAKGFRTVLCPATSCYQDNLFVGRALFHLRNVADFYTEGKKLDGCVITSWTVHLFAYELQPAIHFPRYGTLERFMTEYPRDSFGVDGEEFFAAAGLLAKTSLFTSARSSGHDKTFRAPVPEYAVRKLAAIRSAGAVETELANSRDRLREYRRGAEKFQLLLEKTVRNHATMRLWLLAARNLINRAEIAIFLLEDRRDPATAAALLAELQALKVPTAAHYRAVMYPHRAEELIHILHGPLEYALANLAAPVK